MPQGVFAVDNAVELVRCLSLDRASSSGTVMQIPVPFDDKLNWFNFSCLKVSIYIFTCVDLYHELMFPRIGCKSERKRNLNTSLPSPSEDIKEPKSESGVISLVLPAMTLNLDDILTLHMDGSQYPCVCARCQMKMSLPTDLAGRPRC